MAVKVFMKNGITGAGLRLPLAGKQQDEPQYRAVAEAKSRRMPKR